MRNVADLPSLKYLSKCLKSFWSVCARGNTVYSGPLPFSHCVSGLFLIDIQCWNIFRELVLCHFCNKWFPQCFHCLSFDFVVCVCYV
jgi:hypothetical protein